MKKYTRFVVFIVLITNLHCKVSKETSDCDRLIKAVNTKEFINIFSCDPGIKPGKTQDDLCIYETTSKFNACKSFKNSCNQTVEINERNFEYDINNSKNNKNTPGNGIILYDYIVKPRSYTISFLGFPSNNYLKLTFNNRNKLIKVGGGAF